MMPYIVEKAYEKGMQIALNPSPFNEKLAEVDMAKIYIAVTREGAVPSIPYRSEVLETLAQ